MICAFNSPHRHRERNCTSALTCMRHHKHKLHKVALESIRNCNSLGSSRICIPRSATIPAIGGFQTPNLGSAVCCSPPHALQQPHLHGPEKCRDSHSVEKIKRISCLSLIALFILFLFVFDQCFRRQVFLPLPERHHQHSATSVTCAAQKGSGNVNVKNERCSGTRPKHWVQHSLLQPLRLHLHRCKLWCLNSDHKLMPICQS